MAAGSAGVRFPTLSEEELLDRPILDEKDSSNTKRSRPTVIAVRVLDKCRRNRMVDRKQPSTCSQCVKCMAGNPSASSQVAG